MSYKLTKKAEADLAALVDFSLERFGSETALRYVDRPQHSFEALDRGDFDGPELVIASRERQFGDGRCHRTGFTTTAPVAFFACCAFTTAPANRSD